MFKGGKAEKEKVVGNRKSKEKKVADAPTATQSRLLSSPNLMSDHPVTLEIGNYFLSNCTTYLHLAILDKMAKCSTIPGNFCTNHPWGKMVISKTCLDAYQKMLQCFNLWL